MYILLWIPHARNLQTLDGDYLSTDYVCENNTNNFLTNEFVLTDCLLCDEPQAYQAFFACVKMPEMGLELFEAKIVNILKFHLFGDIYSMKTPKYIFDENFENFHNFTYLMTSLM